ncbi:MAG: hypothetical protein V5A31_01515 [Haloferacaceae archaeon]
MDRTTTLSDRVVDVAPTALLAAVVLVAFDVSQGTPTTPTALLASFAVNLVVVFVGILVFEALWDRFVRGD